MAAQGSDLVAIERSGTLHKTTAQEIADLGGDGGVSLPTVGPIGGLLRLVSLLPFSVEWAEPPKSTYVIWCEENGPVAENAYEWSFGNGATGNDIGFPILVDSLLTHMSFNADAFGTSVQANARKATTPGSGSIVANPVFASNNSVVALPTPVLFEAGSLLIPQTGAVVGSTSDARIFYRFQEV